MNALFIFLSVVINAHANENATQTLKGLSQYTETINIDQRPNLVGLHLKCGDDAFFLSSDSGGFVEARDSDDEITKVLINAKATDYLLNFSDGDQYHALLVNSALSKAIQLDGYWWSDGDHITKTLKKCTAQGSLK